MKNYEYFSENRIKMISERANRCVCKYCGGKLNLQRIIFHDIKEARAEIYCRQCQKIEFGVEPEIYRSAENFISQCEYDHYPELDDNKRKRQMNIAKVCEIMEWCCKDMGIINQNGFLDGLKLNTDRNSEILIVSSCDILQEMEEKDGEKEDH